MPYSLILICREPRRYLPAVMAVAFSDLLITVQVGLLLGALSVLSLPIDHSAADLWVASPEVLSIELGYPIPESWRARLASMPEVVDTEPYLYGFSYWRKPRGGSEVCCVIGSWLERGALGVVSDLTPRDAQALDRTGRRGGG
jgi:putative ABC transport system permease protein